MADISNAVDPIVGSIYAHYENKYGNEKARQYLGASIIGKECSREVDDSWKDSTMTHIDLNRWVSG